MQKETQTSSPFQLFRGEFRRKTKIFDNFPVFFVLTGKDACFWNKMEYNGIEWNEFLKTGAKSRVV